MILTKKLIEYGVILGLISIAITTFNYFMGMEFMMKWWIGIINLLITLSLISYFGIRYRKENGGYLNYWNSYVAAAIMMCVSGFLGVIFSMVLFHVIDPDLPAKMNDAIINMSVEWMQSFKVPQESIDKEIDKMMARGDQFTIAKQSLGFLWTIVGSGILAFLIAAITKKKKPLIDQAPDQTPLDQIN